MERLMARLTFVVFLVGIVLLVLIAMASVLIQILVDVLSLHGIAWALGLGSSVGIKHPTLTRLAFWAGGIETAAFAVMAVSWYRGLSTSYERGWLHAYVTAHFRLVRALVLGAWRAVVLTWHGAAGGAGYVRLRVDEHRGILHPQHVTMGAWKGKVVSGEVVDVKPPAA